MKTEILVTLRIVKPLISVFQQHLGVFCSVDILGNFITSGYKSLRVNNAPVHKLQFKYNKRKNQLIKNSLSPGSRNDSKCSSVLRKKR